MQKRNQAITKQTKKLIHQQKQEEPKKIICIFVAGGSVTSFRFNISDITTYEVIYSLEALKRERIKAIASKKDYFVSADIRTSWRKYDENWIGNY